ncbi:MAG: TerB family tellurite resistance protein [Verrucomicrobiota bacterium]
MCDSSLSLALAKVVAVAAWADGVVQPEERDCLKDLLYQLPELHRKDWRKVEDLLDHEISPEARRYYLAELADQLTDGSSTQFALYALERMIQADGVVTYEEYRLLEEFLDQIRERSAHALPLVSRILDRPIRRRLQAAGHSECDFAPVDEVVQNRVEDWKVGMVGLEHRSDHELRRLCLAGILIARVIHADGKIDERELATAIDFLTRCWHLKREQAEFVMIVSLSDEFSVLDALRISRWLFEVTDLRERRIFLELLFELAAVDSKIDQREIDEIMQICANLRLEHLDFQRGLERIVEEEAG